MNLEMETIRTWCGDLTKRDLRNQLRYVAWVLAWMLSFLGATYLLKHHWVSGSLAYVVALLPSLLGVWAVMAFLRFLRQVDELQRKIQVEALGWGFGSGAVFMIGYQLLERAGLPPISTADPVAVMMVVWAAAIIVLVRRYS